MKSSETNTVQTFVGKPVSLCVPVGSKFTVSLSEVRTTLLSLNIGKNVRWSYKHIHYKFVKKFYQHILHVSKRWMKKENSTKSLHKNYVYQGQLSKFGNIYGIN